MIKRLLYVPPRGIGDMIFSLPLLHSIRNANQGIEIYVPIPSDKTEVLELLGFPKKTERYLPKPSEDPLAGERWKASVRGDTAEKYRLEKIIFERYLEGESFDMTLLTKNFSLSSINCPVQINEDDLRAKGIDGKKGHMVDRFLGFADYLGIEKIKSFDLALGTDKAVLKNGQEFSSTKPYVILHLGASQGKKVWTDEGYKQTARWCLDNGFNVVLTGNQECFDRTAEMRNENGVISTISKEGSLLDLRNYALLAREAVAVVSPDTGLLHIADATGTKAIGLYGPTSPAKYAPYNNKDRIVSHYETDQNVQSITSQEVIKRLEEVI